MLSDVRRRSSCHACGAVFALRMDGDGVLMLQRWPCVACGEPNELLFVPRILEMTRIARDGDALEAVRAHPPVGDDLLVHCQACGGAVDIDVTDRTLYPS